MSMIDSFKDKLRDIKWVLISEWEKGAQQGKMLKKQHKEKINKVVKKSDRK